ncbi:hypothetical protein DESA109040_18295 [Deinococcus saxicola]|uniref:hypothetical protein n=1 Tax=Deinococcus saxicola TaxID=249406 RepID=UPI0039EE360B
MALALSFWTVYSLGGSVEAIALVMLAAIIVRNVAFELMVRSIVGGGRDILKSYGVGVLCGLGTAALFYAVIAPLRGLGLSLPLLFITELLLGGRALGVAIFLGPPNQLKSLALRAVPAVTGRLRRVTGKGS